MMQSVVIDDNNRLDFYDTPWNTRSLGMKTREICALEFSHVESLNTLLTKLDYKNEVDDIQLICLRIQGQNQPLKITLQQNGYRFVETSLKMKLNNLERTDLYKEFGTNINIEQPAEQDFAQIRNIARDDFAFGRFHEDPLIPGELARNRYYHWIDELTKQGKEFLIFKKNNLVISFLAYQKMNSDAELILGGSKTSHGYISYYFWSTILDYFKKSGIRKIRTTISAANLGILNLYIRFGFTVDETLFGFHKQYDR